MCLVFTGARGLPDQGIGQQANVSSNNGSEARTAATRTVTCSSPSNAYWRNVCRAEQLCLELVEGFGVPGHVDGSECGLQ
jgi:hypothetical protein